MPRGGVCGAQMPVSQTMSLVRDVLAGRILNTDNVIDCTKDRFVKGPAGLAGMTAVQGQAERAVTLALQDAWLR